MVSGEFTVFLLRLPLQNKEYKSLNEQLSTAASAHCTEIEKLKKELERHQRKKGDTNQLVSLQEEIDSLRLALEKAHGERKIVEDTYAKEKQVLQKVNTLRGVASLLYHSDCGHNRAKPWFI